MDATRFIGSLLTFGIAVFMFYGLLRSDKIKEIEQFVRDTIAVIMQDPEIPVYFDPKKISVAEAESEFTDGLLPQHDTSYAGQHPLMLVQAIPKKTLQKCVSLMNEFEAVAYNSQVTAEYRDKLLKKLREKSLLSPAEIKQLAQDLENSEAFIAQWQNSPHLREFTELALQYANANASLDGEGSRLVTEAVRTLGMKAFAMRDELGGLEALELAGSAIRIAQAARIAKAGEQRVYYQNMGQALNHYSMLMDQSVSQKVLLNGQDFLEEVEDWQAQAVSDTPSVASRDLLARIRSEIGHGDFSSLNLEQLDSEYLNEKLESLLNSDALKEMPEVRKKKIVERIEQKLADAKPEITRTLDWMEEQYSNQEGLPAEMVLDAEVMRKIRKLRIKGFQLMDQAERLKIRNPYKDEILKWDQRFKKWEMEPDQQQTEAEQNNRRGEDQ